MFDLRSFVLNFTIGNNNAVPPDLKVTLVCVDDNIEIIIRTIFFTQHAPEDIFQNTHHGGPVNVLEFLEFRKRVYQSDTLHFSFYLNCTDTIVSAISLKRMRCILLTGFFPEFFVSSSTVTASSSTSTSFPLIRVEFLSFIFT